MTRMAALTLALVVVAVAPVLAQGRAGSAALLEALARGPTTGARVDAAKALAASKDARALEVLTAALGDANRDVRWAAIEALGELGDTRAVPALLEHVKKPEAYRFGKRLVVNALGALGDAAAADALLGLLGDEDPFVRRLAALALLRLRDSRLVARVAEAAADRADETMIGVRRELARVEEERARRQPAAPAPRFAASPPALRAHEWSGVRIGATPLTEVRARFGAPVQETPEFVLYPGDRIPAPLRADAIVVNIDARGVVESIFVFPAWGVMQRDLRALLGPGKLMSYAEFLVATGRTAQGAGTSARGKLHYLPPDVPTESYAEMGMLVVYEGDAAAQERLVKLVIVQ